MSKNEWEAKFAGLVPLYESGAYTSYEFFWFAFPFFDGGAGDQELWDSLPQGVKDCFVIQLGKDIAISGSTGMALAKRLAAVRRVAMR